MTTPVPSRPTRCLRNRAPLRPLALLALGGAALVGPGCLEFAPPPAPVDATGDADAGPVSCLAGAPDPGAPCRLCDGAGYVSCPFGCDADGRCLPADTLHAGRAHACALAAGSARCWGDRGAPWPAGVALRPPSGAAVDELSGGADHVCLRAGGDVYCAGDNEVGQSGQPPGDPLTALARVPLPSAADALFGGFGDTTCARLEDGALWCWGAALDGQDALAEGATATAPTAVRGADGGVTAVALGGSHACWIQDGAVACWGANGDGQLGTGDGEDHAEPTAVPDLGAGALALAAGRAHTCALTADGVFCWGLNSSGQLGKWASWSPITEPVAQTLGTATETHGLALGERHTLVLEASGVVRCYGDNAALECGTFASSGHFVKTAAGLPAVARVTAGWRFSCALDRAGQVWCWGASPDDASPGGAGPHLVVPP